LRNWTRLLAEGAPPQMFKTNRATYRELHLQAMGGASCPLGRTQRTAPLSDIPVTELHLRFIIQPMNIPVATPIVIPVAMPIENVAITVSTGCRCRRLIVSSMSSSAVSPPCFAIRRVAPKLSSSASASAVVAREVCRAASAIWSPVHSTTDCAMMS
jgi:hypothetical protein